MFRQPFFETLAIAGITAGLLLATVLFSPLNALAGAVLVIGCSALLYRHYSRYGTDIDTLDDSAARPS